LERSQQQNIRVVEDAILAFPACSGERMIGSCGEVTRFSFDANKMITTGAGGMPMTADQTSSDRVWTMHPHRRVRDVWNHYTVNRLSPE